MWRRGERGRGVGSRREVRSDKERGAGRKNRKGVWRIEKYEVEAEEELGGMRSRE